MTLEIGSVSSGTLRPQDLLPCFLDLLTTVNRKKSKEIAQEIPDEVYEDDSNEFWQSDKCQFIIDDLIVSLNENCPAYCNFETLYSDGADFGVWINWGAIKEDIYNKIILEIEDGKEFDFDVRQYSFVLEVNDHGNSILYDRDHNILWSIV